MKDGWWPTRLRIKCLISNANNMMMSKQNAQSRSVLSKTGNLKDSKENLMIGPASSPDLVIGASTVTPPNGYRSDEHSSFRRSSLNSTTLLVRGKKFRRRVSTALFLLKIFKQTLVFFSILIFCFNYFALLLHVLRIKFLIAHIFVKITFIKCIILWEKSKKPIVIGKIFYYQIQNIKK